MKKHFFYAAMALAVMSSCSNDNDLLEGPGNLGGQNETQDGRVAIELGVGTPSVSGDTRGTGTVGDIEGSKDNKWNSQQLFIYMIDEATGEEATETIKDELGTGTQEVKIFDNQTLKFYAPKSESGASGDIRIYKEYISDSDNGTLQYKYYPINGTYTFYGYHIDDATGSQTTMSKEEKSVKGVTINGTQDLLAAKTIPLTENDNTMDGNGEETKPKSAYYDIISNNDNLKNNWATLKLWNYDFSARTARNGIKPILKFDHQLARVKFFVRAGSESAASHKYEGSDWTEKTSTDGQNKPLGMQVTGITLKEMVDKVDIDIANCTSTRNGVTTADFEVCVKDENGKLDPNSESYNLANKPVLPKYPYVKGVDGNSTENIPEGDAEKEGTQVGEPVLFFPNGDITVHLDLAQYVIDTENEANQEKQYKLVERLDAPVYLYEKQISGKLKEFKPGYSYNVYLTIYGFERIEVTAQLTGFIDGGDLDVDTEDNQKPAEEESPLP